eukprot:305509-Amphidinium_carterae.2
MSSGHQVSVDVQIIVMQCVEDLVSPLGSHLLIKSRLERARDGSIQWLRHGITEALRRTTIQ